MELLGLLTRKLVLQLLSLLRRGKLVHKCKLVLQLLQPLRLLHKCKLVISLRRLCKLVLMWVFPVLRLILCLLDMVKLRLYRRP